jgi:hypothetical protein
MIRALTRLIRAAAIVAGFVVIPAFLLGVLPGPLLWWAAGGLLHAAWAFFSLPAPVVGIGVGVAVYVALAKFFHNAPLKAQRNSAIEKAHQAYESQRW